MTYCIAVHSRIIIRYGMQDSAGKGNRIRPQSLSVLGEMIIAGKNQGSILFHANAVGMAVADIRNICPGGNVRRGFSFNPRGHDGAVLFQAQDPV